jgi:hypothetical protein
MRTKRALATRFMASLMGLLILAGLASASGATAMPATGGASPSIASDKADYAPGERVTLTGAGWQPGESVNILVNDDAGSSWRRDVDVTAGADGSLADSFNLPDWFVAEYSVRATGASGSVAYTSFTDGNVKVAVSGGTAAIKQTLYTSANCSGTVKNGFPETVTIPPTDTVGVGGSESLRLDAPATANGGQVFLNWSRPAGGDIVFTVIAGTDNRSVCVAGFQSGSRDIIANYDPNSAPTVNAGNASVTVGEGSPASNTGTYSDANAGDAVAISASRGTVTKTGTSSGTWSWSLATTDGPDETGPVTITASDGTGTATTTFTLNVANVAPTVTLAAANPLSVDEGSAQQTYTYAISDPGADTVSAVATSCGANGAKVAGSDTNSNTSGSFTCTFPDGPASSTVSASATDSDGATGNLATQAVTVANVAPSVSLTGPATADEGETKTYSFTVADPGQDTFSVDAGFPDCDAGATDNGTSVPGSLSVDASGGSFQCFFADGPAAADVKIQVRDSDGAGDAASQSVAVVAVANVAPSVTAPADQGSDEGASASFDLGSFTDPGPDSPWAVDVDWGDGSTHAAFDSILTGTLGTEDHTYADSGSYTVSVKVTDKNGASDTETFAVAVANVAPTVALSASNDTAVDEGSTHTYSYSISDPGADTVSSVQTSCGANGDKVAGSDANTDTAGSFKCTFPDGPASSTVSASATDSDGDTGAAGTQTVAVGNVAPTADLGNDGPRPEGSPVTVSFTNAGDPSGGDVAAGFKYGFACTASTVLPATYAAAGVDASKSCTFHDNGTYVVKGRIFDRDNGYRTYDTSVTVTNVAPTITSFTGTNSLVGPLVFATSTFTTDFTDPGALDTHNADFTWSSGLPASQTVSPFASGQKVNHTFAAGCNRSATVKVTDDDGGWDTKSTTVDVGTGSWLPPLTDQPVSDKLKNGQVLPVKVKIADCNGVSVPGLAPVIQLVKGDQTGINDDTSQVISVSSVSSADTGTTMRSADGFYVYNLKVSVASGELNKDHTIIIHPYGSGTAQTLRHVIVPIK